jgi:hypothetical protein
VPIDPLPMTPIFIIMYSSFFQPPKIYIKKGRSKIPLN